MVAPLLPVFITRTRGKETEPGPRARYFPNAVVRTQDNQKVRFYDDLIKGRIVVINFFYAQCEKLCPRQTANLVKVQKLLGDRVGRDIFMYSITLDPKHDTPEVLKHYADTHGAKPGWWFLTGAPGDIELLRHKLGFVDPDPVVDADKSQHIGMMLFGNEALDRWAACPCLAHPQWMVTSILWMEKPKEADTPVGQLAHSGRV